MSLVVIEAKNEIHCLPGVAMHMLKLCKRMLKYAQTMPYALKTKSNRF